MDYNMFRKAYSFLDDYQENEIKALKTAMKKNKNPNKSAELKVSNWVISSLLYL